MVRYCVLSFCALGLLLMTGCMFDEGRSDVSGTVTLDGQPLTLGMIHFDPIDPPQGKSIVSGVTQIENGAYKITGPKLGLLPGKYKVWLQSDLLKDKEGNLVNPDDVKEMKVNPASLITENLIPPEYRQGGENILEIKQKGKIEYNLDMKSNNE